MHGEYAYTPFEQYTFREMGKWALKHNTSDQFFFSELHSPKQRSSSRDLNVHCKHCIHSLPHNVYITQAKYCMDGMFCGMITLLWE